MITTTLVGLIAANLLILDDCDPEYYSTYVVVEGTVLLDQFGDRITMVQVLHDSKDVVLLFTERNNDNPQNIKSGDTFAVRLFAEVGKRGGLLT